MMSTQTLETRYAWMIDRMARRRAASLERAQALRESMATELRRLDGLTRTARQVKKRLDGELSKLEQWAEK